jgi:hypothetical protein
MLLLRLGELLGRVQADRLQQAVPDRARLRAAQAEAWRRVAPVSRFPGAGMPCPGPVASMLAPRPAAAGEVLAMRAAAVVVLGVAGPFGVWPVDAHAAVAVLLADATAWAARALAEAVRPRRGADAPARPGVRPSPASNG